jgi:hypothetical protein
MTAAALLISATFVPLDRAYAQSVEQRLDELDRKYDDILSILNELRNAQLPAVAQPADAGIGSGAASPGAGQTRYRAGFQHLEVYTLENVEADNLPTEPSGVAVASTVVEAGQFAFGRFAQMPETKHLSRHTGPIMINQSSYFLADSPGEYTFVLTSRIAQGGYERRRDCKTYLSLEGNLIAESTIFFETPPERSWSSQGSAQLSPGYYNLIIGVTCAANSDALQKRLTILVAVAEPGSRAAKPIPAERLMIQE